MHIPDSSSVTFQDGLKDLLGFKNSTFYGGTHISDYQLELNGGITEIYVYSDIIESHFVGTLLPTPSYNSCYVNQRRSNRYKLSKTFVFTPTQNYIDCIEIELKSSSGDGIIFTSGKSLLVLSFRRRTV
ncbi:uncharacterized protein TNCT_321181 [Trichonephila clavata]|uniref:Uncharacterized protein n=1 Tax=Trichonephila clavata TaxID=2740835 RepID=A0A8X6KZP0_TRICU|nr:uncharacterized protein TNCT_321181 [Trichonephila clavata]